MWTVGTTHYVNKFEYFKIAIQNHNKEPNTFMFTSQNIATQQIFLLIQHCLDVRKISVSNLILAQLF